MTLTTRTHRPTRTLPARLVTVAAVAALVLAGCNTIDEAAGGSGGAGEGESAGGEAVTMARATWDTGWFQAEVYRQLLGELGYEVSDPGDLTRDANGFYPALARGEVDLWANGWFPLHEPYLEGELFTGATFDTAITFVGTQVEDGAQQGYLVDRATADDLGLTNMSQLADASVAAAFDDDGDGQADLVGCNEGWGCNLTITEHIDNLDWGPNVEQVVGDYANLFEDVIAAVEAGEPTLFYTWTPNWTVAELVPGEDVVWLESPSLEGVAGTSVEGLEGCAGGADPCDLGWEINDIQAAANTNFLDDHPDIRALLEGVTIPLDDIAAQNAEMRTDTDYTGGDLEDAAEAWISDNRDQVDEWLQAARDA